MTANLANQSLVKQLMAMSTQVKVYEAWASSLESLCGRLVGLFSDDELQGIDMDDLHPNIAAYVMRELEVRPSLPTFVGGPGKFTGFQLPCTVPDFPSVIITGPCSACGKPSMKLARVHWGGIASEPLCSACASLWKPANSTPEDVVA